VEIRQSYTVQKVSREENEKRIQETRNEASRHQINSAGVSGRVSQVYDDQSALLAKAGNTYQNLFNYYLSGLVYEMGGEISDAYLDAKTIHSLNPDFLPTRADLLRYSRMLGLRDDYDRWRQRFGPEVPDALPAGHGSVILLFECGLAPVKEQIKFTVPIPLRDRMTAATISIPKYKERPNPIKAAQLVIGSSAAGVTQPLMDVDATAVRALWDQALGIALRELIRVSARVVLAAEQEHKGHDLASAGILLLGSVIEQADLRCWISLPQNFQALRVAAPAGTHRMEMQLQGGGRVLLGDVPVREGGYTLIRLRTTGLHAAANFVTF
jgi:hypothetical protein